MKKVFPFLLALTLLTGCGTPAPAETEVLPETGPAGPLSAPAIVTEGREHYELPPSLAASQDKPRYDMERWAQGGVIKLLAEAPEADAAFYGLPLCTDSSGDTALIRWGDSLAEFDWTFCPGPGLVRPWMTCFDIDGDWEDELAVVCQTGSGTGVSICELHIVEKDPDGTLTAYTFPESLWSAQVPTLFDTALVNGRTFAILGHELVEFDGEGLDLETASSGAIADFSPDGESLSFRGAFCLSPENSAAPCYVAETSARVRYQDGIFTLDNFHLYI